MSSAVTTSAPKIADDELSFFNQTQTMELKPLSCKPHISPTLGELLKRVEDAQSDTSGPNTPRPHRVLDVSYACSSVSSSYPFVLSFKNLTYSVKVRQKMSFSSCFSRNDKSLNNLEAVESSKIRVNTKVLLNDISGEAREGEIMAVLGASGSGKSTLIDALADRISKESLKGSVTLNGEVLESSLSKVISAYVMQDDLLFPMLSVEETLMFSAEFRLPRSLSKSKKRARVQALIDQLGLRNAAKTVIGDEGHRGVSGGERRRVSIGIDIIHDPILLFLDEPTSGLDSTSAFMVVKVLQRIAQSGSIVIMSIHQPSYRILSLLDRLIFLSHGHFSFISENMGFWGIEVKPGKPHPYHSDNVEGKLHVTQATLGLGSSSAERCILQCHVGHKSPIFLCSLLPDKNETCPLSLEFQSDDLVAFSVIGPQSIHLSGYFVANEGDGVLDDYDSDSFGEDIADTNSDESSEFDSEDGYEDEDDFIDDSDLDMYNPSHVPNSGVVIEEIVDDEKATNGTGQQKRKKKNRSSDSEDHRESQQQIVVKSHSSPVLESEDEDGFPVSTEHKSNLNIQKPEAEAEQKEKKASEKTKKKKKKTKDGDQATGLKRKVESVDQDDHPERQKKKNKKKRKEQAKEGEALESGNNTEINVPIEDEKQPELKRSSNLNQASPVENDHDHKLSNKKDLGVDMDNVTGKNSSEEKKKKKKKKKSTTQEGEGKATVDHTVSAVGNKEVEEKQSEVKSSQVRTFANGLVIEELQMGKPDGKRASPGKQVSVHYIGKLKSNGKIFDSNVGRAPFKFRLGIGHVIKGWDVGVNGMRIGDKRRLTIPPSMGYGAKTAGKIPPNSWLMFDVELVDVH